MPPAKYPSLAFTARDVAELVVEVEKYATNLKISVGLVPKGNDAHRLEVVASCCRRAVCLGQSQWIKVTVALSGGSHTSIDHASHEALWKLYGELTDEGNHGGRYTALFPGWPKR